MLEDVLDASIAVPGWQTWVISPDEAVLEIAVRRGVRAVSEDKAPLSGAIRQVEKESSDSGADALAILLGDVALITQEDLSAALRTLGPVVVAPDRVAEGTNLLLRRPPRAIQARFGKSSLAKHQEAAAAKGLPVSTVDLPGLAFDLDDPSDIATLLEAGKEGRTRAALLEIDAASRLARVS
jgi:2-phospho-L-lactate guanylyltransferase